MDNQVFFNESNLIYFKIFLDWNFFKPVQLWNAFKVFPHFIQLNIDKNALRESAQWIKKTKQVTILNQKNSNKFSNKTFKWSLNTRLIPFDGSKSWFLVCWFFLNILKALSVANFWVLRISSLTWSHNINVPIRDESLLTK